MVSCFPRSLNRRRHPSTTLPLLRRARLLLPVLLIVLEGVADGHGVSAAQVALAYLLQRPAVTSLVIGARTTEQLTDNLAAADLTLSDEEVKRLDDVSQPVLLYPYWHQAKTARDRLSAADLALLRPYL